MPEYLHKGHYQTLCDNSSVASTLNRMVPAYLTCAAWSSPIVDADGHEVEADLSNYDFSVDAQLRAYETCAMFLQHPAATLALATGHWSPEQMGHDLWLTRNRHGAGFWDRYSPSTDDPVRNEAYELGECLSKFAYTLGESYAYVDDAGDGKFIYIE